MDCEWYIEIPEGSLMLISYSHFNLESAVDNVCSSDYVLIRNDYYDLTSDILNLPIMAKHCGTATPSPFLLQGNKTLIVFHSNHVNQYRGFKMTYHIMKERFQI